MGPNASAGKKLKAPISRTININKNTNMPLQVDKVPALVATVFFLARLPAIAIVASIGRNLTKSITSPMVTFRNGVLALKPANADPLLPPAEEYA